MPRLEKSSMKGRVSVSLKVEIRELDKFAVANLLACISTGFVPRGSILSWAMLMFVEKTTSTCRKKTVRIKVAMRDEIMVETRQLLSNYS